MPKNDFKTNLFFVQRKHSKSAFTFGEKWKSGLPPPLIKKSTTTKGTAKSTTTVEKTSRQKQQQQQPYISYYWPDFEQTLDLGFWDQQQ